MKCKICGKGEMMFEFCTDNPDETYAYNVYSCDCCDAICKEDIWDEPGEFWIDNKTIETFWIKTGEKK